MTFWPTEFRPIKIWQPEGQPIGLIGWQGIIPAKAVYMVQKLCDVFVEKVLDVDAIFRRVDPKHVASLTKGQLQVSSHTLLEPESLRCIRNERPFWCLIKCFKNGLLIRTHGFVFCTSSTFDVRDIIAVSCITQRPKRALTCHDSRFKSRPKARMPCFHTQAANHRPTQKWALLLKFEHTSTFLCAPVHANAHAHSHIPTHAFLCSVNVALNWSADCPQTWCGICLFVIVVRCVRLCVYLPCLQLSKTHSGLESPGSGQG
jgi:hypothetical protein